MKKLFLSAALIAGLMVSCDEDTLTPGEAVVLSKATLFNDPGFSEFRTSYEQYEPDSAIVESIKQNIDADEKLVVFVKPSCGCTGTKETFPSFLKTIDAAEIPESQFLIYSMNMEETSHPYQSKLTIKDLPEFHIMKSDEFVYSIGDSLAADTSTNPENRIEAWVAKGLQN